ncbi:MAG: ASKHA domain-containing protein, partial [bacterium]|nr:ASKHA domain-containing protein [bacterium]
MQTSVRNDEVIALSALQSRQLGLAIDLGSTKIAGYLVDLSSGRTLAAKGVTNQQVSYGEDIVSRISLAVKSPAEGKRLQELAVETINQLASELCKEAGAEPGEIVDSVIAGNTAMHHLLLGLSVRQLVYSPFVPAVCRALDIKARDMFLHLAPGAYVHLLPNIAGFVGGDHVAMLLATEAEWANGLVLALDIGTNTEVSLIDQGEITTASCASGPAFEGGHIKHGMRAASGAIERVRVVNGKIQYQTINVEPPAGICGSGTLDALAQLYLAGVLDKGGRMSEKHFRLRTHRGK